MDAKIAQGKRRAAPNTAATAGPCALGTQNDDARSTEAKKLVASSTEAHPKKAAGARCHMPRHCTKNCGCAACGTFIVIIISILLVSSDNPLGLGAGVAETDLKDKMLVVFKNKMTGMGNMFLDVFKAGITITKLMKMEHVDRMKTLKDVMIDHKDMLEMIEAEKRDFEIFKQLDTNRDGKICPKDIIMFNTGVIQFDKDPFLYKELCDLVYEYSPTGDHYVRPFCDSIHVMVEYQEKFANMTDQYIGILTHGITKSDWIEALEDATETCLDVEDLANNLDTIPQLLEFFRDCIRNARK